MYRIITGYQVFGDVNVKPSITSQKKPLENYWSVNKVEGFVCVLCLSSGLKLPVRKIVSFL